MSRFKSKGWIVAISHAHQGPVGNFIQDFQERIRKRIINQIERTRQLGGIRDEDLVLVEYAELKDLDPKHWKDQDHYAVLGLPKLRHRATQDQIKFAYRKAVLKHHPDKRRRQGEKCANESDDYFTCITRAYEVLGTLESRRSYDSIDPIFDDDIPSVNKNSRENFFPVFTSVFERNSRWSLEANVPLLGDEWSSIEEVDRFYNFWYNFNSWREYSYLDEENKEKAEDAYERRWMEKQNRAARATRKKEENQRMRQLVDNAYACDPRVKRFKDAEKKKKEDEKAAKVEALRRANEERKEEERKVKKRKEEEERRAEEEIKKKQAEAKKEKEKEKKLLKKERQKLKTFCKEKNYFRSSESERLELIHQLNHLCVDLELLQLQQLNEKISSSSLEEASRIIEGELNDLKKKIDEEKRKHLEVAAGKSKSATNGSKVTCDWSYEDLQLLVKAVNLFPAGTTDRWQVVAKYLNTHSSLKGRSGRECLARAKNLKESDLKAEANQKAFEKYQEKHSAEVKTLGPSDNDITKRFDASKTWTSEEQKRLEQALKTYPTSTEQRWEKIAEAVTGRSKKECMLRYKELVEMVKAKKAMKQQGKKS
ncbi:dnaJ homolog subfamily C member 2-like [Clavelina lepadiformis]|uniref:dnaJ homolog subfamily C member 2-like n=1 Tax=Clavelina lepadiformis TaxID=159417 RepID=UPI00404348DD